MSSLGLLETCRVLLDADDDRDLGTFVPRLVTGELAFHHYVPAWLQSISFHVVDLI